MKHLIPVMLLALLWGCSDKFPPSADTPPVATNSRIVFTEYLGDDSMGVNSLLQDGTDLRFVSLGYTASSPASGRIAFVRNHNRSGEVVVSRLDGLDAVTLVSIVDNTDFLLQFATLSPKGDLVAYTMREPGQDRTVASIFVIPATGGTARRVATDIIREGIPYFSPDGTRIAWYTPDRTIRTVRTDGSEMRVVATGAVSGTDVPLVQEMRSALSWSPSGDRITFTHGSGGSAESIATVNADGTGQASLTLDMPYYVAYPSWSPDGSTIAFMVASPPNHIARVTELWLMDADGGNKRLLTAPDTISFIRGTRLIAPEWSPDGKKILFVSHQIANPYPGAGTNRGIGSLRVVDVATGAVTTLVQRAAMMGYWVR
jgi:Tol biopolymer transport system component